MQNSSNYDNKKHSFSKQEFKYGRNWRKSSEKRKKNNKKYQSNNLIKTEREKFYWIFDHHFILKSSVINSEKKSAKESFEKELLRRKADFIPIYKMSKIETAQEKYQLCVFMFISNPLSCPITS